MTTANPWKKRKAGGREFMPPSRALFAEIGAIKATATWVQLHPNEWKCVSASRGLRWMRGMTSAEEALRMLETGEYRWHWIEPNTVRVLAPPF